MLEKECTNMNKKLSQMKKKSSVPHPPNQL